MAEYTKLQDYLGRLQDIGNLGASATSWTEQNVAAQKAKAAALQQIQNQQLANQQVNYNVTADGSPVNTNNGTSGSASLSRFGIFPVQGYRITDKYGPRTNPVTHKHSNHTGMDFATGAGKPIYAVADGTVRSSLFDRIYGNQTILDFGGGISSMYGHQSRSIVKPGQRVKKGQVIGYVGSTGRSTGPHLHFETWVNNKPVNPLSWFAWN